MRLLKVKGDHAECSLQDFCEQNQQGGHRMIDGGTGRGSILIQVTATSASTVLCIQLFSQDKTD